MDTRANPLGLIMPLLMVLGLGLGLVIMSANLHLEALDVEETIDSRIRDRCAAPGLYYSEPRGTLLVLVQLPNGDTGGQVIRFTEHLRGELVPTDKIYEATCFGACEAYWCRVLQRDGYMPLAAAKYMAPMAIFTYLTALVAWLRARGRGALADAVEDA